MANTFEETRTSELYNMLLSCVGDGHTLNTVEKVNINLGGTKCGYHYLKALNNFYMDSSQKNVIMAHYKAKLKDIYLNYNTSATAYTTFFE